MPGHRLPFGIGIVSAQTLHLPPFDFQGDRVVHDQVTCHDSCLGAASTLFPPSPLAAMLGLNLRLHLISKVTQPRLAHFGYRPLPTIEEPG